MDWKCQNFHPWDNSHESCITASVKAVLLSLVVHEKNACYFGHKTSSKVVKGMHGTLYT